MGQDIGNVLVEAGVEFSGWFGQRLDDSVLQGASDPFSLGVGDFVVRGVIDRLGECLAKNVLQKAVKFLLENVFAQMNPLVGGVDLKNDFAF